MGSVERRLKRLEVTWGAEAPYEVPMTTRLLLKAVERHRARERGEDPPAYTQEELEALHAEDLDNASGAGVVETLRESGGWESPEGAAILDSWEDDARRRLARVEEGEPLELVYDEDEGRQAEG